MNWKEFSRKQIRSCFYFDAGCICLRGAFGNIVYSLWVRSAFQIDDSAANQVTDFDMKGYNKIEERFGLK